MEAGAVPKEAQGRPLPAPDAQIVRGVINRGLHGVIRLLLKAVARFRRLLKALARQPGLLISAVFRAPGSLANLVRFLLSSKPARLLVAAAASIICITLQWHRPTTADIHLSSSISLLFGMVKLQGSLALQLGPPDTRVAADLRSSSSAEPQDELRINCPKDLRESIVRFLESQAARSLAPPPPPPPPAGPPLAATHEHEEPQPLPPVEEPSAAAGDTGAAAKAAAREAAVAALPGRDAAALPGRDAAALPGRDAAAAATAVASALCAAAAAAGVSPAPGAAAVLPCLEALLPATPPLAHSPPAKAAGLSGVTATTAASEAEAEAARGACGRESADGAAPALDRADYLSLMSYTASYRPCMAPLGDSPGASGLATQGSSTGLYGSCCSEVESSTEPEAAPATSSVTAAMGAGDGDLVAGAAVPGAGTGSCSGRPFLKSPDSILGLRGMEGLEGWAERNRDWESRYLEE